MTNHLVSKEHLHYGWDKANPPALTVAPGDVAAFDVIDAGGGQIAADSTLAALDSFDFDKVNPAFGPVYVDGAEPGDALKVVIEDIQTQGWGWTANIPGFGLLADIFEEPALHIWKFDPGTLEPAVFEPGGRVPLKPFPGIMGLAPAAEGNHGAVTPLPTGGNMDTRDLSAGTELYLPVEVPGALFSIGDGHAAQGDGEVCGTAIEAPMKATIRFDLVKGAGYKAPRFATSGPVTRHLDAKGYWVTTGVGPDLMASAKNAVMDMVEEIAKRQNMRPVDAYMLCSVCADLRISEIVDMPHWIVSCYFPRVVFE
jgi:acetamidase/formamidase